MRLFASPKLNALIRHFRPPEGEAMSDPMLTRLIETAQKRVEGRNYTVRKHTLEYDDVMNKQRQVVYALRNEIIHSSDILLLAREVLEEVGSVLSYALYDEQATTGFQLPKALAWLYHSFPAEVDIEYLKSLRDPERAGAVLSELLGKTFDAKMGKIIGGLEASGEVTDAQFLLADVARSLMIFHLDAQWKDHIVDMDLLRSEVGLRTVGQKDPLLEFKQESFLLFEALIRDVRVDIAKHLLMLELTVERPQENVIPTVATSFNRSYNEVIPKTLTLAPSSGEE